MQNDKELQKMGIQKKSETVRVVIRCRPLSKKEINEGREKVVKMEKSSGEILVQKSMDEMPKRFTFDCVYDENTFQKDIFDETAFPIIENILEGYNGTIFAYGQTGTGKTHTMSGILDSEKEKGVTPRAFETIFKSINIDPTKQYLVRASYLEIYREEVLDLLNKGGVQKLELKEKPGSGVYVKDLSTALVETPEKLMEIMVKGNKNRHVGQTKMNHESSRSHSIFTVTVECAAVGTDGKAHIKVGKLNMVDLAGSEKQSKTGSEGVRLEEAIKINLSLTTLCHVISSLVDGKSTYVPYRDSRLTRLLQDSLGGNTKTIMIANIGPADYNMEESVSTLRYASRAKHIQNKPRINEDPKDAMLREFQEEIQRLREQLEMAGGARVNPDGTISSGPGGVVEVETIVYEADKKQMKKLEAKLEKEKQDIKRKAEEQRKKIVEAKNLAEDERQKLLDDLKKQEENQEKAKTKQQKLLKRLKNMEEKVLQGNEVMNKAMKQEIELQKTKAELEEKRRDQLRIQQEMQEAEEQKDNLQKEYKNQSDELVGKKEEYQKIWNKYRSALGEKNDLDVDIQRERESLMMRIRELTNDIRLKHLVIDNYIPAAEYVKIERRAEWNEEMKEWQIPNLEYTGNNIKKNKKMQKEGKKIDGLESNFLYEHILNFEEDSEEEDYKEAATMRVKSMISNILVEEGEDEQLAAFAETQPAVYYKYTDNGAEREDPEKSKKAKNKKKGVQSAKRPITAKKMKKGDIVSMVETMTNSQHITKLESKKIAKIKKFPKAKGLSTD
jgi:hypothetical protein